MNAVISRSRFAVLPMALLIAGAMTACVDRAPPPPPVQPASDEPGPPPASPVVPVQSQPLGSPQQ